MDDLELIQVNTGKSVTEVEDVLAADLGGQWTTSGMRGRVLAAAAGRVPIGVVGAVGLSSRSVQSPSEPRKDASDPNTCR